MTDAPCKSNGDQRLMLIVAISFVFEADVGFVWPARTSERPILMHPTAVDGEGKRWSEQPVECRVDAVFRGVAALCWVIEIAVQRQDRFVGNRWIIKGKRTREQAITGDSVGQNVARKGERYERAHEQSSTRPPRRGDR